MNNEYDINSNDLNTTNNSNIESSGISSSSNSCNGSDNDIKMNNESKKMKMDKGHDYYYYNYDDICLYDHNNMHLMKPFRSKLVNDIMNIVYSDFFNFSKANNNDIKLATRTDIGQYHSDNYLALLQICDNYLYSLSYQLKDFDFGITNSMEKTLANFNLGTDINPLFPGIYEYSRL